MLLRHFPLILLLLLLAVPAPAAVEIARSGQPPVTIEEVYLQEGVPFIAVDDVLAALQIKGDWDSVSHRYSISTSQGRAIFFPGSHYLRVGERFLPLEPSPRFIDGRLRVAENFVTGPLARLLQQPVYYRNLNPGQSTVEEGEGAIDRLFAFLLRKKKPQGGPALRGIAIDPGHGGQDPGALGIDGVKEKDIALAVGDRLQKLLKMRLGIPVYLSRDGDYEVTRQQRLQPATKPDVDAFLLLHAQASFSPSSRGTVLLIRPEGDFPQKGPGPEAGESRRLAQSLARSLAAEGIPVEGILEAPLLPLGRGDLPTVLIELGYLSNTEDAALLRTPEEQERLARALFAGLKNFSDQEERR